MVTHSSHAGGMAEAARLSLPLVAASLSSCSLLAYLAYKYARRKAMEVGRVEGYRRAIPGRFVELSEFERKTAGFFHPVCGVNFYRGKPSVAALVTRLEAIVAANPWLAGEYRKHPVSENFPSLWVPHNPDIRQCVRVVDIPELREGAGYATLEKCMRPLIVNGGEAGRPPALEPLFLMAVGVGSDDTFCLSFSMCHTLGDAHTLYRIISMLAGGEITAMRTRRIPKEEADSMCREVSGPERLKWMTSPFHLIPFLLKSMLLPKNRVIYHYVNEEWIRKEKKRLQPSRESGVKYISTNDVLASTVMRSMRMPWCNMLVNLRGRFPEKDLGDVAGNLITAMLYFPPEYKEPVGIRLPFTGQRHSTTLPGRVTSALGNMGTFTSRASWSTEVPIPGCVHLFHLPFRPRQGNSQCVVWRASNDRLAIGFNGTDDTLLKLSSHPMLGKQILPQ